MTEAEYMRLMLNNCEVSIAIERESILKSEARIETIEGYKQAFTYRLKTLEKTENS